MSSRGEHRRPQRDWERDDRDRDRDRYSRGGGRGGGRGGDRERGGYREERRRTSRSRSPRRGGDRDRDRRPSRREPRKDDDRRDDRRDRDRERDRDRRDGPKDDRRRDEREHSRADVEEPKPLSDAKERDSPVPPKPQPSTSKLDHKPLDDEHEEGEEMDALNEEEAAMMDAMGVAGFGSTKGKHVTGNQDGAVNIKRQRTWRQYMNRRGGFNRPLDKIK